MYQVLYRKWRPRTFSEVCGQPYITAALQNEVRSCKPAHAYLFVGSRGTGKTSCAKILAKAVNCLHPVNGDPCNACENCLGIDSGSVTDVMEIDAASNNGVDNIRDLRESVNFTPAVTAYRVYIIDEVHMLSPGAFNALLKTLEEPPAHVIFILATTEVHKLPATILSRCQRFDFARISPEDIAARLQTVAQGEGFTLEADAALLLGRLADGAMRDALSLTDQCLSRSREITVDVVSQAAGLAGRDHLFTLSKAVREHDAAAALREIDRLYTASRDMGRLCAEWLEFYRELMLCKSVRAPQELIAATDEEIARLKEEAEQYALPAVVHAMETLQDAGAKLSSGGDKRLQTELAALKLCRPELDSSVEALLPRVQALEQAVSRLQKYPRSSAAQPDETALPQTAQSPPAGSPREAANRGGSARDSIPPAPKESASIGPAAERPFAPWRDVLARIKETSPPLYGVLEHSRAGVNDTHVILYTDSALLRTLMNSESHRNALINAIAEVTGRRYRIGVRDEQPAQKADTPLEALLRRGEEGGVKVIRE